MSPRTSLKLTLAALLLIVTWTLGAPPPAHAVPFCGTPTTYYYSGGGFCIFECSGQEVCEGNHTGTVTKIILGHCMIC
jgi:hypothetical protein